MLSEPTIESTKIMAADMTEEMYHDQEREMYHDQEEEESNEHASSIQPNSSFLLEMNLVMIIASLALSNQDLLEFEDMDKDSVKEQDMKAFVSKLKSQKREFNQLKMADRQTPRLQTRVLDSRHGRKM